MSQLKRNPFQLTILAMAVLSLSACSTTSNPGGFDFGGIGDGLGKLGAKTAELGSNAWEGTKDVLNIGPQEPELLDEVDLALMEEDAVMDANQSGTSEVQIAAAESLPVLKRKELKSKTSNDEGALAFGQIPEPTTPTLSNAPDLSEGEIVVLASSQSTSESTAEQPANGAFSEVPVAKADAGAVQLLDLTHEVKADENLWQIAKTTTGDANNWHVLADINNLPPNASVFVGQKLIIPADMVDPKYSGVEQPVISDTAETKQLAIDSTATAQVSTQPTAVQPATATSSNESAVVALQIPEAKPETVNTQTEAVAAAEQSTPAVAVDDEININPNMSDALALEVGHGETLWDFAKRTTGDATNWKTIAKKNMFNEQQIGLIRPGQKIYVPANILRARDASGALIAKGEEGQAPNANIGGVAPTGAQAIAATAAVMTGTNKPEPQADATDTQTVAAKSADAKGDIKIVEAAFQDDGAIKPVTAESLSKEASLAVDSNNAKLGKVMVKGTYYPKAVYNNADFSSSLLMRVSPGTQLLVSKAIGPWLEVKTEKGIGYVHSRDIK